MQWPEGKSFAFTVFDDTDHATLENVRPVYAFLAECGLRTTKSVWPLKGTGKPVNGGDTCENNEYLSWLFELKNRGFEIAYHMATYHTSLREQALRGLERFSELFGEYPKTMANHASCRENIYWGDGRMTGFNRVLYNLLTRYRYRGRFRGDVEGDLHFWGDACRDKIKYVRGFVFPEINTLKMCPMMPYHDPLRPLVNYWFASSEGPIVDSFNHCLSEEHQDRLEEEGGACIMYTHFGAGFAEYGKPEARFRFLIERLSRRNGWFVPVSELLDYLQEQNGRRVITDTERTRLERIWLKHKVRIGTS